MKKFNENNIDDLVTILKNDGIICVPTDTVYGICGRVNSDIVYNKLLNIKKRSSDNPFPVMCADINQIESIAIVNDNSLKLIKTLMPGPVTLVLLKKKEAFNFINNKGLQVNNEVAVRMATSDTMKKIIYKTGCPVFLTSANQSGMSACNSLDEIEKTFPTLDGILCGNVSFGQASTIIDCTSNIVKIQRPGPIGEDEIYKILNNDN